MKKLRSTCVRPGEAIGSGMTNSLKIYGKIPVAQLVEVEVWKSV